MKLNEITAKQPLRPVAGLPKAEETDVQAEAEHFADVVSAPPVIKPLPGEAVLTIRADECDLSIDGEVMVRKQRFTKKDGWHFITLEIKVLAALILACLFTSCQGYSGSFTVGYTGQTPDGNPYTIGVSIPVQRLSNSQIPQVPVAPVSAKEALKVQP